MAHLRFETASGWVEVECIGRFLSQLGGAKCQIDGMLRAAAGWPGGIEPQHPVLSVNGYERELLYLFENPGTPFALKFDGEDKWRKWYVERRCEIVRDGLERRITCLFMPWGNCGDRNGYVIDPDELVELQRPLPGTRTF